MHAAVGRVVTTAWGEVYLRPELGRCYEVNQAWAVADAGGLDAEAIDRDVERLMRRAGLPHRQIAVEQPAAQRLADDLAALGYGTTRHLYLAHEGPPPTAPDVTVHEIDVETLLAGYDRYLRTDPDTPYGRDAVVRSHLLEHHRTYGSGGPARERRFAVLDDRGEAVAWAKLWTAGGMAQVEDVICLAEHRGRGYGRAVVATATLAGLAGAPELLVIAADADDWPKELYGRLGYVPVGGKHVVIRHPLDHDRRRAAA
jgi:hypothetical protein